MPWFIAMSLRKNLLSVESLRVKFSDLCFFSYMSMISHFELSINFFFADDTKIFLRHDDLTTLTNILNVELFHVSSWFNANKLNVHPAKSKFIIFHPRRKHINSSNVNLFINKTTITCVHSSLEVSSMKI